MADEKEEVLANLYAIRAVISAAYLEYDESEKIKGEYAEKVAPLKERATQLSQEQSELEKKIENNQNKLEEARDALEINTNLGYEKTGKNHLIRAGLILLMILWLPAFPALAFFASEWIYNAMVVGNDISIGWFMLALAAFYLFMIFALVIAEKLTWKAIKWQTGKIRDLKEENQDRKDDIERNNRHIRTNTYEEERNSEQLKNVIEELANKKEEITKVEAEGEVLYGPRIIAGNVIYDAGVEKYGSYLRETDWESVDYLIYLLETSRADTLKEALQQCDAERRKNEIVQCIQQAVTFVGTTISSGLQRIEQTVSAELSKLDKIVAEKLEAIADQMKTQNEQLSNVSGQLDQMGKGIEYVGQVTTYNAALSKMIMHNTNEMVRGIKQLKRIASSPVELSYSTVYDLKH